MGVDWLSSHKFPTVDHWWDKDSRQPHWYQCTMIHQQTLQLNIWPVRRQTKLMFVCRLCMKIKSVQHAASTFTWSKINLHIPIVFYSIFDCVLVMVPMAQTHRGAHLVGKAWPLTIVGVSHSLHAEDLFFNFEKECVHCTRYSILNWLSLPYSRWPINIVFIYYSFPRSEYSLNTVCWTLSNSQSIHPSCAVLYFALNNISSVYRTYYVLYDAKVLVKNAYNTLGK